MATQPARLAAPIHTTCPPSLRTFDPEEADFFYVPIYSSCFAHPIYGFHEAPWWYAPGGGQQLLGAAVNETAWLAASELRPVPFFTSS